ncbi:MAG: DUF460 domain-containing protein [Candidatus Aenigmatarchaeota archaeon]
MNVIVGVDPGVTTGIAIIDLKKNSSFCKIFSEKGFSFNRICEYISGIGTPVIVATDVAKPPEMIKRVAASFNAVIFKPGENMTTEKKKQLTKNFPCRNKHQRDALAAAIKAKKAASSFLIKIDGMMESRGCAQFSDEVKSLILKGKACNVDRALLMIKK